MEHEKKKTGYFTRCSEILKNNPVEIFIGLAAFILYTVRDNMGVYYVFPILFSCSYFLNRQCHTGKQRVLYYLSALLVYFLCIAQVQFSYTAGYLIVLAGSFVLLFAYRLYKDNRLFTVNAVQGLLAAAASVITAGIIYLIASGIYGSINVIFLGRDFVNASPFYEYLAGILYTTIAPLIFFAFIGITENNQKRDAPHFINILSQYVLTPSLILYTAVLYLYFLKILFLWELPDGGIAIMSLVYIVSGMLAQAINKTKAPSSLFFKFTENFQYIAQPAVIMMWIACVYRICEYGYTEPRIYLLVTNAAVTLALWMMMYKKTACYRNMALLALFLFLFFTYIPGFSAKTLGFKSQRNIAITTIKQFYQTNTDGSVTLTFPADTAGKRLQALQEQLSSAINYCRAESGKIDGQNTIAFDTYIKEKTGIPVQYIKEHPFSVASPKPDTAFYWDENSLPISGYSAIHGFHYLSPDEKQEGFRYMKYTGKNNTLLDSLKIISPDQKELVIPSAELRDKLIRNSRIHFYMDTLDMRIIFSYIDYQKTTHTLKGVTPKFVLTR